MNPVYHLMRCGYGWCADVYDADTNQSIRTTRVFKSMSEARREARRIIDLAETKEEANEKA